MERSIANKQFILFGSEMAILFVVTMQPLSVVKTVPHHFLLLDKLHQVSQNVLKKLLQVVYLIRYVNTKIENFISWCFVAFAAQCQPKTITMKF